MADIVAAEAPTVGQQAAQSGAEKWQRDRFRAAAILEHVATVDPDSLEEYEAHANLEMWARHTTLGTEASVGLSAEDAFYDPKTTWVTKLKKLQNVLKTASHKDAAVEVLDFRKKSKDEQRKDAFANAGLLSKYVQFRKEPTMFGEIPVPQITPDLSYLHEEEQDQLVREREAELFSKEFFLVRQSLENRLSPEAIELARAAVERGGFTQDLQNMTALLPPEERGLTVRYAEALRKYDRSGFFWELGKRTYTGTADLITGGLSLGIEKQELAIAAAKGLASGGWRDAYSSLEQMKQIHKHRATFEGSFKDKWNPDSFVSRSHLGVLADSVGYMVLGTAVGPAALLRNSTLVASLARENARKYADAGFDNEKAELTGLVVAGLQLWTERIVDIPGLLAPGSKGQVAAIVRNKFLDKAVRGGITFGTVMGGETIEEVLTEAEVEVGKQLLKGEYDPVALRNITQETVGVMAKAGAWFALLPTIKTLASSKNAQVEVGVLDAEFKGFQAAMDQIEQAAPQSSDPKAFSKKVLTEWVLKSSDPERAIGVLVKAGVENAADLHQELSKVVDEVGKPEASELSTISDEMLEDFRKEAAEYGYEVELAEYLIDPETGGYANALFHNGRVMLSMEAEAPMRDFRHELLHGMMQDGKVTPEEMAWFQKQANNLIRRTGVDVDYSDLNQLGQLEEALADLYAESQSRERTTIDKVMNFLRRAYNLMKGLGFKTLDDVFDAIASRRFDRSTAQQAEAKASRVRKQELPEHAKALVDSNDVIYNGPWMDPFNESEVLYQTFTDTKSGSTFMIPPDFSGLQEKLESKRAEFGIGPDTKASRMRETPTRAKALRTAMSMIAAGEKNVVIRLRSMFPGLDYSAVEIVREARQEVESIRDYNMSQAERFQYFTEAAKRREVASQMADAVTLGLEAQRFRMEAEQAKREAKEEAKADKAAIKQAKIDAAEAARAAEIAEAEQAIASKGVKAAGIPIKTIGETPAAKRKLLRSLLTAPSASAMLAEEIAKAQGLTEAEQTNAAVEKQLQNTAIRALNEIVRGAVPQKHRDKAYKAIAALAAYTGDGKRLMAKIDKTFAIVREVAIEAEAKTVRGQLLGMIKKIVKSNAKNMRTLDQQSFSDEVAAVAQDMAKAAKLPVSSSKGVSIATVEGHVEAIMGDDPVAQKSAAEALQAIFPSLKGLDAWGTMLASKHLVDTFGDLKSKDVGDLQTAMEEFRDVALGKNAEFMERVEAERARIEGVVEGMKGSVTAGIDAVGMWDQMPLYVRILHSIAGSSTFNEVLDQLDKYVPAKKAFADLRNAIIIAENVSEGMKKVFREKLDKQVKDVFDGRELKDLKRRRPEWAKYSLSGKRHMSADELLNIWLTHQQQSIKDSVEKHGPESPIGKQAAMLPEIEAAINEAMGPKAIAVTRLTKELLQSYVEPLRSTFKEITGLDLDVVEDYWHIVRDTDMNTSFGGSLGLFKAFMKQRVLSDRAITDHVGAFDNALHHGQEVIQFVTAGKAIAEAKRTVLSPDVMNVIRDSYGREGAELVAYSIMDKLNGKPIMRAGTGSVAGISPYISLIVRRGLSFSLPSAGKQVADAPSIGAEAGWRFWMYAAETFSKANIEYAKEFIGDDAVMARISEGFNPHTVDALRKANSVLPAWMHEVDKVGLRVPGFGDALSVVLIAGPAYRAAMDTPDVLAIQDMDKRREAARALTMRWVNTALQSPHATDRPLSMRGGNQWAMLAGLFTGPNVAKFQSELSSLKQAVAEWRTTGKPLNKQSKALLRKVVHYHIISGLLQYGMGAAIRALIGDTPEDFWKEVILASMSALIGPLSGIPFWGNIVLGLSSMVHKETFIPQGVAGDVRKLGRQAENMFKQTQEFLDDANLEEAGDIMLAAGDILTDMFAGSRHTKQAFKKWLK